MSNEHKAEVVEIAAREVDPVEAWLRKMRARVDGAVRAAESGVKVGRALADLIDEAGKALRRR